jgi:hypothetical protein
VLLVTILAAIVIGNAAIVMFHTTDAMQWSLAVKAFMWAITKVLFWHQAIHSCSTMVCSLACRGGSRSGVLIIHVNSTLYFVFAQAQDDRSLQVTVVRLPCYGRPPLVFLQFNRLPLQFLRMARKYYP